MEWFRQQIVEVLKRQRNDASTGFWAEVKLIDYIGSRRATELLAPPDRREKLVVGDCDKLTEQIKDLIVRREAGYPRSRDFEVLWFDQRLNVKRCADSLGKLRVTSQSKERIRTVYDEDNESLIYESDGPENWFDYEPRNVWVGAEKK